MCAAMVSTSKSEVRVGLHTSFARELAAQITHDRLGHFGFIVVQKKMAALKHAQSEGTAAMLRPRSQI